MKIKILILMVFAFMLFSCASDPYRGITPFGPDTYTSSATPRFRTPLLNKADEFCKSKNQVIMPVNEYTSGRGLYVIVFRCLSPDDTDYVRRDWEQSPSVVIEDRKNKP